jgi:hypothetical protein
MNCDVDENGPVPLDELTRAHFNRVDTSITKKNNVNADGSTEPSPPGIIWPKQNQRDDGNEPTIEQSTAANKVGSQECVGRKTNAEWAKQRIARKSGQSVNSMTKIRDAKEQSIHNQSKLRHVSWVDVALGGALRAVAE